MNPDSRLFFYALHLADNSLVLGQRNAEWCGHGPVLEQDIAITNISLDLIGQARNLYAYAASMYNGFSEKDKVACESQLPRLWRSFERELQEDDLAFLREERQFLNLLITELPRGDWSMTILRQFLFSAFQWQQYKSLSSSSDQEIAAIAEKSLKEVSYHRRWSAEWVIRLGDGTEESKQRIERSLKDLWMFTGEMFQPAAFESGDHAVDPSTLKQDWLTKINEVFHEAGMEVPSENWTQSGGKKGIHTEHLGFLLAEMQSLQRTYPNATW